MKTISLEEVIPSWIEIVHGNHIRAYINTPDNGDPSEPSATYPLKIAVGNNETELLERIIAYLESDVSNLKRNLKTFQPEAVR
jgi:hypothetical protein